MTDKTDSNEREAAYDMVDRFLRNNLGSDEDYAEYSQALDTVLGASLTPSGFDAADMATAWSNGFRDGVASLAASAGSEPVAWRYVDARGHFRYVGYKPSRDMSAEYPLLKPIRLYLHPSPPEGMVGGWIASKDQMPPPGVRVFWGDVDSHRVGYDSWAGDDYRWAPSHWMHIPEFPTPPTSSADSRKGGVMAKKTPNRPYRSRADTTNPCAICGWGKHMAIHLPVIAGPRKGEPWGHSFVPLHKSQKDPS